MTTALTELRLHAMMDEVSVCFCCCRSVKKTDPVWFSDVSGQHLGKEIYVRTDTHAHTLTHTHLLPWADERQRREPAGQACVVRRRRLNTKQTPHQTQSKFTWVAGSSTPSNPSSRQVKLHTIFVRGRGNRKSTLKWQTWEKKDHHSLMHQ